MQNTFRFLLLSTKEHPVDIFTKATGFYINDTLNNSILGKENLLKDFGITDKEILSLFDNDEVLFDTREKGVRVITYLKSLL